MNAHEVSLYLQELGRKVDTSKDILHIRIDISS